jgi:hypothetical protein
MKLGQNRNVQWWLVVTTAQGGPERAISLLSRASVLLAVAEADHLGREAFLRRYGFRLPPATPPHPRRPSREAFLRRYGFRPSKTYELDVDGRRDDSKAICGVAYGHEFASQVRSQLVSSPVGRRLWCASCDASGFTSPSSADRQRVGPRKNGSSPWTCISGVACSTR